MPSRVAHRSWPSRTALILCLLFATGAALRLFRLDWQAGFIDEDFSLVAADKTFAGMNAQIIADGVSAPLHYWMLWIWLKIFGFGLVQSRLLSVACGTLTIPALFLASRRLIGEAPALSAAAILAVSQFAMYQSQEGRMYAMGVFLTVLSFHAFLRALQQPTWDRWLLFALVASLLLMTHYYAAFVLAALGLSLLFQPGNPLRQPRTWVAFAIPAGVLALWIGAFAAEGLRRHHIDPIPGLEAFWYTPVTAMNWLHSGKWMGLNARSPLWTYPAGAFLFALPALLSGLPWPGSNRRWKSALPASASGLLWTLALVPALGPIVLALTADVQYGARYSFLRYARLLSSGRGGPPANPITIGETSVPRGHSRLQPGFAPRVLLHSVLRAGAARHDLGNLPVQNRGLPVFRPG